MSNVCSKTALCAIINRGTGAGGKRTNKNGKAFEKLVDSEAFLTANGFMKKKYYFQKDRILYFKQGALKKYMKETQNISMFRHPDEAFIDTQTKDMFIIEMKEQSVQGSVETKLWSAPALKREYELIMNGEYHINYIFCLNSYLYDKLNSNILKYNILLQIFNEHDIKCYHGKDVNEAVKKIVNLSKL
jgi:hypothetical protein